MSGRLEWLAQKQEEAGSVPESGNKGLEANPLAEVSQELGLCPPLPALPSGSSQPPSLWDGVLLCRIVHKHWQQETFIPDMAFYKASIKLLNSFRFAQQFAVGLPCTHTPHTTPLTPSPISVFTSVGGFLRVNQIPAEKIEF